MSTPAPEIKARLDTAIGVMIDDLTKKRHETRNRIAAMATRLSGENAELEALQHTLDAMDIELAALTNERKRYSAADL
jgi:chorismate mutase